MLGEKKKREEEIQVLKYAISLVLLFSSPLSLSLNRAHILAESYTHVTKTHTRTNAKERKKKKGNRKKERKRGRTHKQTCRIQKHCGIRSSSFTYISLLYFSSLFFFFFSFFFLWCLVRVVAVLVVAAEAVGAIVHVVLHKHQIAVALRVPRHDLVHRSPPRQVPRLQPLFLRV